MRSGGGRSLMAQAAHRVETTAPPLPPYCCPYPCPYCTLPLLTTTAGGSPPYCCPYPCPYCILPLLTRAKSGAPSLASPAKPRALLHPGRARGSVQRRVRSVRGKGRDVSGQYGKRDETCPISTGKGTRRGRARGRGGCERPRRGLPYPFSLRLSLPEPRRASLLICVSLSHSRLGYGVRDAACPISTG